MKNTYLVSYTVSDGTVCPFENRFFESDKSINKELIKDIIESIEIEFSDDSLIDADYISIINIIRLED